MISLVSSERSDLTHCNVQQSKTIEKCYVKLLSSCISFHYYCNRTQDMCSFFSNPAAHLWDSVCCFVADLLHAPGVKLASCHRYSDHTGGKGEQESVARPVQSQRQQLPGRQRVLRTPATHKQAWIHKANNLYRLITRLRLHIKPLTSLWE